MRRLAYFMAVVFLSAHTGCVAQELPDALSLIGAAISNADVNSKEALRYTFNEEESNIVPDMGTTPTPTVPGTQWPIPVYMVNAQYRWSTERDVLFIEGVPYRRVMQINGQKLPPDLAALESDKYDHAVTTLHALSAEQRQQYLSATSFAFDPRSLKDSYSCRLTGHEKVEKRPAIVVECKPDRACPKSVASRQLHGRVTLWIDKEQPFFHRIRVVLDCPVDQYGPGTTVTDTWSLMDGVWHETSVELSWIGIDTITKNLDIPTPGRPTGTIEQTSRGTTITVSSKFKKFQVESTIITP
jgi:hypothetical protein